LAQERDTDFAGHIPAGETGSERPLFLLLEIGKVPGYKSCLSQRCVSYSFIQGTLAEIIVALFFQ
jgi:hypothetical protein